MQLALILLTLSLSSHAVDISTMDASKFKRTEGTFEQCGDAILKTRDAGAWFDLSVYHIFSTENYSMKVDADIEPLKGCVYDMTNSRTVTDAVIVLTSNEVLNCGSEVRHNYSKHLTISPNTLTLEVRQLGNSINEDVAEPTFNYRCVWTPVPPPKTKSGAKKK